jgi:hypothetical protein
MSRDRVLGWGAPLGIVSGVLEDMTMLNHELMRDDAILVVSPDSELSSSDLEDLARPIDPFIEDHGSLAWLRGGL